MSVTIPKFGSSSTLHHNTTHTHIRLMPQHYSIHTLALVSFDRVEHYCGDDDIDDGAQDIMILDHKAMPIASYDYVRKTFTRHPGMFLSCTQAMLQK